MIQSSKLQIDKFIDKKKIKKLLKLEKDTRKQGLKTN